MTDRPQPQSSNSYPVPIGSGPSITEQAAEWFITWHAGDITPAQSHGYFEWLLTSPAHVAAMLHTASMYGRLRRHCRANPLPYHAPIESERGQAGGARLVESKRGIVSGDKALDPKRVGLNLAWKLIKKASDRDPILWAEDPVPVAPRISQALGMLFHIPETTLKLMASYERQRRSKRTERLLWILGVIAASIISPIAVSWIHKLLAIP